ncbi:LysR substrate-binding domain-containing protein [Kineococcus sp. NUM-3379]
MDLQQLRYFAVLAEELHFTRAARRLYLDQSTLSAAIRRLERDFGVQLFDRSSRRVSLTEEGRALVPEAQRLLAAGDRFTAAVGRARSGPARHRLVLGLFLGPRAAAELTGPIVHAFRARHPELALDVRPLDIEDPFGATHPDMDVVLGRGPGLPGDVVTPLFSEQRVVVVSCDDDLPGAGELALDDLGDRPWVGYEQWPEHAQPLLSTVDLRADGIDVPRKELEVQPFAQVVVTAGQEGLLGASVGSAMRLAHLPGKVARPVPELGLMSTCVYARRDDMRTRAFTTVAVEIAGTLLALVPEAQAPGRDGGR